MNYQKIAAGLMAVALLFSGTALYTDVLTESAISANASADDVQKFLDSGTVSNQNYVKIYNGTSSDNTITMKGRRYTHGVLFNGYGNNTFSANFDVSAVSSLQFSVGHVDDTSTGTAVLKVYLDDSDTASDVVELSLTKMTDVDRLVDVSGASSVRLDMTFNGGSASYAVTDIKLDGEGAAGAVTAPAYPSAENFVGRYFDKSDYIKTYNAEEEASYFQINGRNYYQGIIFNGYGNNSFNISYNVESVDTISFTLGHVDNSGLNDGKLNVYVDNELTDTFELKPRMLWNETPVVDVSGGSVVRFELVSNGSATYAMSNIKVNDYEPTVAYSVPAYRSAEHFLRSNYDSTDYSKTYTAEDESSYFRLAGRSYYQGILFNVYGNNDFSTTYNVENVNTISFSLGHVDNTGTSDAELNIYVDGVLKETYSLKGTMKWKEDCTVDVSDGSTVRFVVTSTGTASYAMADFTVDESAPTLTHSIPEYATEKNFIKSNFDTSDYISVYSGENEADTFTMGEQSFYQGLVYRVYGNNTFSTRYNVENVDSIQFTAGHLDSADNTSSAVLSVYGDGQLMDTVDLVSTMNPKETTIDVSDKSVVMFSVTSTGTNSYGLGNFVIAKSDSGTPSNPDVPTAQGNLGDLNNDGNVDAKDSALILRYAAYVGANGLIELTDWLKDNT